MQDHFEGRDADVSMEELFLGLQESFSEAQARAIEENKPFARTEFFRFDKLGTYRLRVLPLAPSREDATERRGYEYPVHQLLMELQRPGGGDKPQSMYVTAPRATEAGYTLDLIDTYRRLASEAAREAGDEKLAEKISGGSYGGGLRFNFGHAMYIIDLKERAKGLQLLTLSHAQFKELDERRFKLWEKKLLKNPLHPCPVSSVYSAYPVEVEKRRNGGKTEYLISIDNESDNETLSQQEMAMLMNSPRIPEVVYRYTRYHFEATLVFLAQCDVRYGLRVMENPGMIEAVESFRAEIPREDTSSFSFDRRTKEARESAAGSALTLDGLCSRFEELKAEGLGDKTEQGQELRAMIRSFIEQEKLPVRVTRSVTNDELLDMIEDAFSDAAGAQEAPPAEPGTPDAEEEQREPTQRRR